MFQLTVSDKLSSMNVTSHMLYYGEDEYITPGVDFDFKYFMNQPNITQIYSTSGFTVGGKEYYHTRVRTKP